MQQVKQGTEAEIPALPWQIVIDKDATSTLKILNLASCLFPHRIIATPFLIIPSGQNSQRDFQSDSTEREYCNGLQKEKLNEELVESCLQRVVIATPSSLQSINRSSHPAAPPRSYTIGCQAVDQPTKILPRYFLNGLRVQSQDETKFYVYHLRN
ncbi:hypothetical protein TNCT_718841 [Trichonephila clavata]|uniref:Uncharacterized protein n=1 Tax=Trichonephila clavata TaxID=2740835 RepID=A0A8X6KIE5_TRICU|nr:hypothetical protein TNCT_718841 [Trichonephila clavata]